MERLHLLADCGIAVCDVLSLDKSETPENVFVFICHSIYGVKLKIISTS